MLEKTIEQKLTAFVKKCEGLSPKLISPGMIGMPDRLVLLPGGHMGFVEVKAPGEKPRLMQIKRHEQLQALGFRVFVLDNEDQIKGVIDAIQAS